MAFQLQENVNMGNNFDLGFAIYCPQNCDGATFGSTHFVSLQPTSSP